MTHSRFVSPSDYRLARIELFCTKSFISLFSVGFSFSHLLTNSSTNENHMKIKFASKHLVVAHKIYVHQEQRNGNSIRRHFKSRPARASFVRCENPPETFLIFLFFSSLFLINFVTLCYSVSVLIVIIKWLFSVSNCLVRCSLTLGRAHRPKNEPNKMCIVVRFSTKR